MGVADHGIRVSVDTAERSAAVPIEAPHCSSAAI